MFGSTHVAFEPSHVLYVRTDPLSALGKVLTRRWQDNVAEGCQVLAQLKEEEVRFLNRLNTGLWVAHHVN